MPSEVAAEAREKLAPADRRSDEAWEQALPVIEAWAEKGKPYIPWAAAPHDLPQAEIPTFPGAQGGGMYSFGGRGGKVYVVVTNLNDRGPGSFREALEAGGPRIVVFNVAGIIRLDEKIRVRGPYITIDGSRAPGDGVCITGDTVEIETHDVVIRHLRFRRGEKWVGDRNARRQPDRQHHRRSRLGELGARREPLDVPPHVPPAGRRPRAQAADREHHDPKLDRERVPRHVQPLVSVTHPHITTSIGILGGEPIIDGTRTPVRAIVEMWRMGVPPEGIPNRLPHLTLSQVFAAHRRIERNRIPDDKIDPTLRGAAIAIG